MQKEKFSKQKILDLGCGSNKLSGKENFPNYNFEGEVIGLDSTKTKATDIVYDLNKGKLPFKDDTFDIVYTNHSLEHIKNVINLIPEVFRVLKKGGKFLIRTPHISCSSNLTSLTHVIMFGWNTLDGFLANKEGVLIEDNLQIKDKGIFKLIKRRIIFGRFYRFIGIECVANKIPMIYTEFFSWIFPAREMHFELEK